MSVDPDPEPDLRQPHSERVRRATPNAVERPSTTLVLGMRGLKILEKFIDHVFSDTVVKWGLSAVVILSLGIIALIPSEQRMQALAYVPRVLDGIGNIIQTNVLAWLGWPALGIYMAVSIPFQHQQHKRIRAQGSENAELRQRVDDAERLSSRDPKQLDDYESKMRAKFKDR